MDDFQPRGQGGHVHGRGLARSLPAAIGLAARPHAVVFLLQAIGLAVSVAVLLRIDILGFARDTGRHVDLLDAELAAAVLILIRN